MKFGPLHVDAGDWILDFYPKKSESYHLSQTLKLNHIGGQIQILDRELRTFYLFLDVLFVSLRTKNVMDSFHFLVNLLKFTKELN